MIDIKVNNEAHQIPENSNITTLIQHLAIDTNGIAIAINDGIVRKDLWEQKAIVNNDTVLIIKASPGG